MTTRLRPETQRRVASVFESRGVEVASEGETRQLRSGTRLLQPRDQVTAEHDKFYVPKTSVASSGAQYIVNLDHHVKANAPEARVRYRSAAHVGRLEAIVAHRVEGTDTTILFIHNLCQFCEE